ncbi:MAG: DUF924 domain-containing protein [Bdellovibrionales bacterium]|nr:DUF924 domain-containing protein [Bdellovibrionales bacterium]
MLKTPKDVLEFWFGQLDENHFSEPELRKTWWESNLKFDNQVRLRFFSTHQAITESFPQDWLENPKGQLAYIIVLDQFSRNMYRGTPNMYSFDSLALSQAKRSIQKGVDVHFKGDPRSFFYLPFMHSEELSDQEKCVELFKNFLDELQGSSREYMQENYKFAIMHRDIVKRFGRFPHRNKILGRPSTPDEEHFLKEPGSSF